MIEWYKFIGARICFPIHMIDVDMTRIIVNQVKNLIQKRSKKNCISIFFNVNSPIFKGKKDHVNPKFGQELFHPLIKHKFSWIIHH